MRHVNVKKKKSVTLQENLSKFMWLIITPHQNKFQSTACVAILNIL